MIDDFSTIKSQLKELAPIINEFKSEQVQLCLIEIIFNREATEKKAINNNDVKEIEKTSKSKRKKPKSSPQLSIEKSGKKSSSKKGPVHYLSLLIDEGYFNQPRQINEIVKHLKDDNAITYKANVLSPALARLVRSKKLKRNKNSEKQFEYEKTK